MKRFLSAIAFICALSISALAGETQTPPGETNSPPSGTQTVFGETLTPPGETSTPPSLLTTVILTIITWR
jgi:hypothetical protein